MLRIWQWITATARWLASAWRVWVAFAVFPFLFLLEPWLPGTLDNHLRYIGLAFELFGVGAVAYGLRDRWLLFDRPTPLAHLRSWLDRRPRWGGTSQSLTPGTADLITVGTSARLSLWRGAPAGSPVGERVAALEANVETLRGEQAELAKRIEEEAGKQAEALSVERKARTLAIDEIQGRVETLGVGGVHLELLGLISLVLGATLATLPTEIADWLRLAGELLSRGLALQI